MQLISFDNGYQRGGGVNLYPESVIQCWSKSGGEHLKTDTQGSEKNKDCRLLYMKIRSHYTKKILQSFAIMLFQCTCAQEKTDLIKVMVPL